ncbi:MAG: hypothetical protein KDH15_11000 [Rhodocyclaceae bacterium]|nr:hypothetical protein [Rhodocyclaceae bacterium]
MSHHRPKRGEIQLADLIRALQLLAPADAAQREAIAGCLGFGLTAPDLEPVRPTPAAFARDRVEARKATAERPTTRPEFRPPEPPPTRTPLPPDVLRTSIDPAGKSIPQTGTLDFLAEEGEPLPRSAAATPVRSELFPALTARATLSAMLRTRREGDAPDTAALIRQLIRGLPTRRLPRLPAGTLAHGCQLLLDYGEAMAPWFEDLDGLASRLSDVLGKSALTVFDFDADPGRAATWVDDDRRSWAPEQGRPVLVATGFSIRGHKIPRQLRQPWRDFVATCRAAGCPLILLTPWQRRSCPDWLGRYPSLVHWNPATTAAIVRRLFGVGHETGQ